MSLGEYLKTDVREFAKSIGLEVSDKPDSQDFYEGDYNELLEVEEKEGNIVDTDGKILGKHKGIWNFTFELIEQVEKDTDRDNFLSADEAKEYFIK